MYKVEWLDDNGEIRTKRNFKTYEEAYEWIKNNNFDLDFEMPMASYDGDDLSKTFPEERSNKNV